jgi:hypothetical protein
MKSRYLKHAKFDLLLKKNPMQYIFTWKSRVCRMLYRWSFFLLPRRLTATAEVSLMQTPFLNPLIYERLKTEIIKIVSDLFYNFNSPCTGERNRFSRSVCLALATHSPGIPSLNLN